MAILSTLLAVSEPTGMWETIIKAFEGFTNNYILAIILLTVLIRIVWAPIDTLNKKMTFKMTANQAKMQPELEKIKAKYANNPQQLQQKQNELYKKYNTNSVGSCLFMLVFFGLNMAIFFTLFSGLNTMAAFKTSGSYEALKYDYANCLQITDTYLTNGGSNEIFKDFTNLSFEIFDKDGQTYIAFKQGEDVLYTEEYKTSFASGEGETLVTTNAYVNNLIVKYINPETPVVLIEEVKDGEGNVTQAGLTLSSAIQSVAMKAVEVKYDKSQDKFLWIQNIWIADSPLQNSIFDYNTFVSKVGKNNIEEGEETIYNSFMKDLKLSKGRVNGYFILPIICILTTFLTMFLTTRKKKGDTTPAPAGGKVTKILMPIIFGVFALFYNSVFAIYMAVSQIISGLLIPLQNLILDKWNKHDEKKKKEKIEVVDYSRKF